ncbi:two-component regulator system yien regulator component protein [Spiroplasma sabaudiense Ar-1343]|uniref:Two-component regulator system yien regulator component protein n=1 Tax=Spiroplasma sabaudiense Ar-1343 TaxID=1276257 RepID=W6AAU1_9MOLU|nr:AAA family ATPase [Spiroplasma sabaudiense]AHI54167.1 two-component regulator system yien regulator component protein [Spiroplasma sabaudiense Ar-1343]
MREKIEKIVNFLTSNLYEREEAARLTILAMFAGESIFLYGKPGLGKSNLAKLIKSTVKDGKIFEYLMNKYSTPDEIFGPLDIDKLTQGEYLRKIEGYLPSADIVFLDEIWKAGPSIQNTLLTIINEKEFRNGSRVLSVPLKLLISASNEFPDENQGLEALYDRFLIRYEMEPIRDFDNIVKMVNNEESESITLEKSDLITPQMINEIIQVVDNKTASKIIFSSEVLEFIEKLKINIEGKTGIYISDRRWKKILRLMKVSAVCSNRTTVEMVDTFIVNHTLWNRLNNNTVNERTEINILYKELINKEVGVNNQVSWAETEIKSLTVQVKNVLKNNFADKNYTKEIGIRYKSILKRIAQERSVLTKASSVFFPVEFNGIDGVSVEIRNSFEKSFAKMQKLVN